MMKIKLIIAAVIALCGLSTSAQTYTYEMAAAYVNPPAVAVPASVANPFPIGRANSSTIDIYGLPLIVDGNSTSNDIVWLDSTFQGPASSEFVSWHYFSNLNTSTSRITESQIVVESWQACGTVVHCVPTQITIPFSGVDAVGNPYNGTFNLTIAYHYAGYGRSYGLYGEITSGTVTLSEPLQ
jgi:hypothetical protein